MSEKELQKAVIELCHGLGFRVAHFCSAPVRSGKWVTPVVADSSGFPDLVIAGHGVVAFAELKGDRKYPQPKQREWIELLRECGLPVFIWKPKDWTSGVVESALVHLMSEGA